MRGGRSAAFERRRTDPLAAAGEQRVNKLGDTSLETGDAMMHH